MLIASSMVTMPTSRFSAYNNGNSQKAEYLEKVGNILLIDGRAHADHIGIQKVLDRLF
jgi:hypothetical protein